MTLEADLHGAADDARWRFSTVFLASMERVRRRVNAMEVAGVLAAGPAGEQRLADMLYAEPIAKDRDDPVVGPAGAGPADLAAQAYAEVIADAANRAVPWVARTVGLDPTTLHLALDVKNFWVEQMARVQAGWLVTEVTEETRRSIRLLITDAVRSGRSPYAVSKDIQNVVGLHSRQAQAVANYANGLDALGQGTMSRGAVTSRWTLGSRLPLRPMAQAAKDRLVAEYAHRQLRVRAMNIARTETLRASNLGQQALWNEMIQRGILMESAEKVWVVFRDERLCDRCAPMGGAVVRVRATFTSTMKGVPGTARPPMEMPPSGHVTTLTPPLHPSCRCTLMLVKRKREFRGL